MVPKGLSVKRLRQSIAFAAAVAGVVVGLTAGGGAAAAASAPKKIITFVYAPRGFNDATMAWWNGFDQAARQLGSSFTVEDKGTSTLEVDPAPYLQFIQAALVEKPAGIVVTPAVGAPMKSALETIIHSGIKVLIMDSTVPGLTDEVSFVGTNNYAAGTSAAKWMIREYKDKKLSSNQIAILEAPPGPSATNLRAAGFKAAIKGSGLKVAADLTPGLDTTAARAAMANVLTAHPKVAAVYSVTDIIGIGAASTLVSDGRTDVKQISVDGTAAGVQLILSHKGMTAEIAQNIKAAGYLAVTTLAKSLDGQKVPANVFTPTTLVTAANANAYLKTAAQQSK